MQSLLGRNHELESVDGFMKSVPEGFSGLLLRGEPGIGKTAIWRGALDSASARSFRVLSARPAESETQLSFTALIDLLDSILEDALPTLPAPQRRALEVALLRSEAEESAPNWQAVSLAVLGVLRSVARTEPIILAVDDMQWLDASSARVLEFVFRRVERLPLGIAGTVRDGETEMLPLGLERAIPQERMFDLAIGPLTVNDLDHLLRARLGLQLARPTLVEMHRVSRGNPFYALEMGRALMRRGSQPVAGEALPVSDSLRELVHDRLSSLPDVAMEALLTVSALSQATVSIVESAMGSPDRATEGLAMASLAGLIEESGGRVRFTHPLYKSVVYADAALEKRRRLHRQLAEIVSDPEECARHMAVGAEGPDDAVAEALEKAAGQAASRGAPSAAAELAELALRLTPPDQSDAAFRRGLVAGDHHFDAGDAGRARSMFEELAGAAPPGVRRAEVLCRLATVRAHQENWSGAQQLFEEALKEAGPDERTRASIGRDLAWVGLMRGQFAHSASQAQVALELAERVGDPSLLSEVLTVVGFADFTRGQGRPMELLERAVDMAQWGQGPRVMPHPGFMIGILLKWSDRLDEARERFELVLREARERGDEGPLPYFLYHLAELECWAGNWERASAHAREGYEWMLQTGQDSMVTVALYAKGLVDAHLGRIDEAREAASIGLAQAERRDASIRRIQNLGVLGFLDLSIGDADAAARRLELADTLAEQAGAGEPGIFRYQGDLIEALVRTGSLDRAESVVASLEARGKALNRTLARGIAARGRALLAAAVGDFPTAIRSAQEALGHHEPLGQPFELARTLVVVGEVQRRDKDKGAARASLQRACSIFEQLGASVWCRRAQDELARTGGRTDGPGKLTETEHQVAVLVAAGKTNPEVADMLFMSRKTVESNLSRIYHKLGIRNRFELARRLAEIDQA